MNDQKLDLQVVITYPRNDSKRAPGEHYAVLEITDAASGYRLVTIELDANDFVGIVGSHYTTVKGEVLDAALYGRVGMGRKFQSVKFPPELIPPVYSREPSESMVAWATRWLAQHADEGWTDTRWHRTNSGWELDAIGYTQPDES